MESLIVFSVGDERIGIDIDCVREVTETQYSVSVPKTPSFLMGLVNIRGNVIPVISLRKRLHFTGDERGKFVLIVENNGRVAGLKVDELYGTIKVDKKRLNNRSELLSTKKEKDFFSGVYEGDEKPILILNLDKTLLKEDK